jgi:sigma-B regulation protein RsbU (phosphoserine phosphatase)
MNVLCGQAMCSRILATSGSSETRSELCVPLKNEKGKVIGVVDLEARRENYFTESHERMLTLLAARIAGTRQRAQLYARVSETKRRMDREMKRDCACDPAAAHA